MDEMASIRAFMQIVNSGSFTAAGRALGVSTSVVTKRLGELEARLKAQLLVRSTRRLTLTDAGSTYFEHCVRIVDEADAARAAVQSRCQGLVGRLRVSCIASFTAQQLSVDLCQFQLQHPSLSLELQQNDRLYDPIQEGYDVCIQTSDIQGDGIIRRPVATLRRMLVSTPAYLARAGQPKAPQELADLRVAHNFFISPARAIRLLSNRGHTDVPIRPVILSNSIWMIRDAVLHGECIGILPVYFILDELCSGALVPIFPEKSVESVTLSAYFRRSAHVPVKVRMLIDFLTGRYFEQPPWEKLLREKRPDLAALLV